MPNDNILSWVISTLIAAVTAIGGAGFFTARAQRNRINSEGHRQDALAEVALSDAAIRLLGPYREAALEADRKVAEQRREIKEMHEEIRALQVELEEVKKYARALQHYIISRYPDATEVPEFRK